MRVRSLRRDLVLGLGLGLTALWVLAMLGASVIVREEMGEVYDSLLEETADRILPLALQSGAQDLPAEAEVLLTWVLRDAGSIVRRSGDAEDAVFATPAPEGFSTIDDHRHFVRTDGSRSLDVASPLEERREAGRGILLSLLVPALVLLPLSLLGIAWFTGRSFQSVTALSAEVAARAPEDLHPLTTPDLKAEMLPIRDAVNRLMGTLDTALEAERAFSANAAHELRTPIAATLAHVQRLLAEADGPLRDRAVTVEAELKRVARLMEKLLQLARAENVPGPSHAIDAVPILRMVADDLRLPLTGPEALPVRMDPDALAILTRNLAENAARHGHEPRITLSEAGRLTVVNAGPIVAPERLPLLTRRFERAGARSQGSGLGLAIVAAICRNHDLTLHLASPAPGQRDGFEAQVDLLVASARERS
ncbi:sensor histidine kinase [Pseudoroseicyclus aestuarii]|uniref:histidine kinase n=1 Tax=Pseudoroseicyclus aestuarii TaxID=1795041 RepID=A0A318T5A3_9RHOB|nr:histidine kinase dimerization/phospho-acceptor domain-containing protein [Pseudoroseicyclus aestuarii]PYE82471.1 two-component system OmpR family sensor kinase [Pseudoroseicyclus aestuarii]